MNSAKVALNYDPGEAAINDSRLVNHDPKMEEVRLNDKSLSESQLGDQYILYPYRWLMQFSFSFALASTGII